MKPKLTRTESILWFSKRKFYFQKVLTSKDFLHTIWYSRPDSNSVFRSIFNSSTSNTSVALPENIKQLAYIHFKLRFEETSSCRNMIEEALHVSHKERTPYTLTGLTSVWVFSTLFTLHFLGC